MRRVLCVWFPRLATECLPRSHRGDGRPVVVVVHGGTMVAAVSEAAEAAGVRVGMGWGDARARCSALLAVPPDREREAVVMRTAVRLVERYGPWVVPGADDLLIDVAGTAHLFGGERAMLEDCRRVLAEHGWSVRAAVAGGADAARGLARFANADLPIGTRDTVCELPVEALRLDGESAARLRRVGLRCVGDLASRSRTALAERFGERLLRRLDRMLGASGSGSEPLGVRPPRPALRVGWEGTDPLVAPASVEAVCAALLEKLCRRLRRGDLGARKMLLMLHFDAPGAEPRRIEARAGRGLRDPGRWLDLFRERPEAFDPGRGVVRLELAARAAEPFDPAAGSDREGLWERLSARLGSRNVVRFRPVARHRPEAASEAEPVLARISHRLPARRLDAPTTKVGETSGPARIPPPSPPGAADPPLRSDPSAPFGARSSAGRCGRPPPRSASRLLRPSAAKTGDRCGGDGTAPDGPRWMRGTVAGGGSPRPLRLLARPEPVGVEAVSDDPLEPPAVLRRRGGRPVRLSGARGPERIAPEWWCEGEGGSEDGVPPAGRDYWRVETEEGVRLWLYRDLHPGPARWFLHGFFP